MYYHDNVSRRLTSQAIYTLSIPHIPNLKYLFFSDTSVGSIVGHRRITSPASLFATDTSCPRRVRPKVLLQYTVSYRHRGQGLGVGGLSMWSLASMRPCGGGELL